MLQTPGRTRRENGKVRVLKVFEPVRQSEMTEIHDGNDLEPLHFRQHHIRPGPIVAVWPQMDSVVGRAVAQISDAEFVREAQIVLPVRIMSALCQFVLTFYPLRRLNGRITALDAGGKQKALCAGIGAALRLIMCLHLSTCLSLLPLILDAVPRTGPSKPRPPQTPDLP